MALFLVLIGIKVLFVETLTYVVTVMITNFTLNMNDLFMTSLTMIAHKCLSKWLSGHICQDSGKPVFCCTKCPNYALCYDVSYS